MQERLTVSPTEAARLLGISRPLLYTLMRRTDFPAFHCGSRVLISTAGLEEWIAKQTKGGDAIDG